MKKKAVKSATTKIKIGNKQNNKILFENPPVTEVVVELRWDPIYNRLLNNVKNKTKKGSNPANIPVPQNKTEVFFSSFADEIAKAKFLRSERLVPNFISAAPFQPVFRFRKEQNNPFAFQVGDGIFSAHAVKPYHSWENFEPIIKAGISSLINSRKKIEGDKNIKPFIVANLLYINIFDFNILKIQEDNAKEFISNILKIQIDIPDNFKTSIDKQLLKKPVTQSIKITFPLKDNMEMIIDASHVLITDTQNKAVIMNILINVNKEIIIEKEIINLFNKASEIAYSTFFEITKPIHPAMGINQKK